MMVRIYYGDLQIERISHNSGLFTGENTHDQWRSQTKINEGFGRLTGRENRALWNQNILFDWDFIDLKKSETAKKDEKG